MVFVKKKKKYVYNYPENKEFNKYLITGDKRRLAVALGITEVHVGFILRGERKMTDEVKNMILRYGEINKLKDQIVPTAEVL